MTNDLFPPHYDAGQLRVRCERLGLTCVVKETWWEKLSKLWRAVTLWGPGR